VTNYRQNPGAPWDPRQTPGVQPGARLLFADEFARGGAPIAGVPNGQAWEGLPPGWFVHDPDGALQRAYIDAARQVAVMTVSEGPYEGFRSTAMMLRDPPPLPEGASEYDYTIYARVFAMDLEALAANVIEANWGACIVFQGQYPTAQAGGVALADVPISGAAFKIEVHGVTADGQTVFLLGFVNVAPLATLMAVNGQLQSLGADYTPTATDVTFHNVSFALNVGDVIEFYYQVT
jgi:hypothetical protein